MIPAGTRAQAECWMMRLGLAQKPPMRLIRLAPATPVGGGGGFLGLLHDLRRDEPQRPGDGQPNELVHDTVPALGGLGLQRFYPPV